MPASAALTLPQLRHVPGRDRALFVFLRIGQATGRRSTLQAFEANNSRWVRI
jgi:hypothetical protein